LNNTLLINAKSLRTYQTDAELRLWYHLRAHRFLGYKFKRQKPIAQYIVDFVCIEQKLIIEIDGGQHAEQLEYDQARDTELRRLGYQVLRFWNNDVLKNTEGVLEKIREFIELTTPSPPAPLPQAGEGSSQLPSILTKQSIPTASFPSPIHGRGARGEGTLYLGIDFGTSGARASAIDAQKNMLWEQRVAYPDAAAQTALDWRNALHTLLSDLPKDIAVSLRGIAIDGTSGTVLLCDAHLEPVSPALLYNDNRAHEQATQLKAIAPYSIAPSVQSVCTSTSGLAKFLWLTQRYPNAHYFLHQADWLTALLSGKLGISDYHNALKTGYDVAALCWPDWILALPHAHLLPKVVAPGFIIGTIQADVAAHFGIAADCAIHAGTTDSIAAFMASDVHEARVGVTSLGTTLVIKQLSGQRIDAPPTNHRSP
jgi:very-short-patch-repair endonuclease